MEEWEKGMYVRGALTERGMGEGSTRDSKVPQCLSIVEYLLSVGIVSSEEKSSIIFGTML